MCLPVDDLPGKFPGGQEREERTSLSWNYVVEAFRCTEHSVRSDNHHFPSLFN